MDEQTNNVLSERPIAVQYLNGFIGQHRNCNPDSLLVTLKSSIVGLKVVRWFEADIIAFQNLISEIQAELKRGTRSDINEFTDFLTAGHNAIKKLRATLIRYAVEAESWKDLNPIVDNAQVACNDFERQLVHCAESTANEILRRSTVFFFPYRLRRNELLEDKLRTIQKINEESTKRYSSVIEDSLAGLVDDIGQINDTMNDVAQKLQILADSLWYTVSTIEDSCNANHELFPPSPNAKDPKDDTDDNS